jgi:hypothetical protein
VALVWQRRGKAGARPHGHPQSILDHALLPRPHLLPGPGPRRGLAVLDHALLPPLHHPLHDVVPGHGSRGGALPPGHLRVREENTGPVAVVRGVQSRAVAARTAAGRGCRGRRSEREWGEEEMADATARARFAGER